MTILHNKRVLIGISGGIAAYKIAELVRLLIKNGAEVRVCMTPAATQFITPLTIQALTANPVHTDLLDTAAEAAMGHIELARWADLIMLAPATADLIARLSHGHANDLLSTICLATDKAIHLAPAMNRLMWSNPATQANCDQLLARGYTLHGPAEGQQACGETGAGRMFEPQALADIIEHALIADDTNAANNKPLAGINVLITAGPTREAIDPVRYISNRSSGKMGYAIATAAHALGANVQLVSGPVALEAPQGVSRVFIESAADMHKEAMTLAKTADIFIATAAVADYSPAEVAEQKIKKQYAKSNSENSENTNNSNQLTQPEMTLSLKSNKDILSDISHAFPELFSVGFAAETENLIDNAKGKLQRKKLDMVVANQVGNNKGFDKDTNQMEIIWEGGYLSLAENTKTALGMDLMKLVSERFLSR